MLVWQVTCDFKHVQKKNIDPEVRTGYLRRNGKKGSVISTQTGNADYSTRVNKVGLGRGAKV